MQTESKQMVSCMVSLTVVSGPDEGMTKSFRQARVTLGRATENDFVLNDGFVSNCHAEVLVNDKEVRLRDLGSRHGSTIVRDETTQKLHVDEQYMDAAVETGTEVQLGSSLVRVAISPAPQTSDETARMMGSSRASRASTGGEVGGESLITTAHRPVGEIDEKLEGKDKRLAALFRLAGELNALTTLDEVLDVIVETTFDAFPGTNFFAVTLGSDPDEVSSEEPFMMRTRGDVPIPDGEDGPILSTSILRRVAASRESVLFTKDNIGTEVTQSIIDAQITACMCSPLVGQKSLLGIMQVDTRGRGSLFSRRDLELFNILASNAAFAIERARLTENIVEMFEGFVSASVNAIEARDPVTAGHSERVAHYTLELAQAVNGIETGSLSDIYLDRDEMRELRYAALLHDFGKIAVREDVLQKGARLPQERMRLIRQRFDTIKELAYRETLRTYVVKLERGEARPDGRGLARIDRHYEEVCRELDEVYDWLREISTQGYLPDEQIARVKSLGQQTYLGVDGKQHPYLTPMEVENLCIQKGTLNEEEWVEMRSHAALSESYLYQIPWSSELQRIPCIAGAHHEKLDGSGYPVGLAGDELIPQVRMVTISDIFDALTAADRPYRKAAGIERALKILTMESDEGKLDAELVDVFEKLVIPRIKDDVPKGG